MMVAVLFISLAVTLLMGIPVAFSMGISTMLALVVVKSVPLVILVQRVVDGINSFTLLALPLFVLSGAIMAYGSTPRIMKVANMLLHKKPWGIGNAGIWGCAAFGTISGSAVATTAAIGSVIAPEMVKNGYKKGYVASIIAASGTLGAIIPPSIAFIVYAQISGVSIKDMFMAGFLPGILIAILLSMYNRYKVQKNGWGRNYDTSFYDNITRKEKMKIVLDAIPPLLMPVIILGGVLSGICTPTEASAVAVVYSLVLSMFVYRALGFKEMIKVFERSVITSCTILLIIGFANPFAWLMAAQNITTVVANWVLNLSGSIVVVYGAIIIILIILGTFMEGLAISLITVPIFLPIVSRFGVDPIAYGITSGLCGSVGTITPPLAVTLFTSCRIVKIRVDESFPEILEVVAIMTISVILVTIFPQISTFLPSIF